MFDPAYLLLATLVVWFALFQWNLRAASPVVAILNRWLFWILFAAGGASICTFYGLIDRPFWVVCAGFFLLWFLGETLYNWLAIQALSVSSVPLFPKFAANSSGEEWPTAPRLLRLRDWLRSQNFRQAQALKAEVAPGVHLRVSIYQDATAHTRFQVTFLPQPNGTISVCCSLSTQTVTGYRYVTDNLFLPFAGFYPENWLVERRPWTRSPARLLARHCARLKAAHEMPLAWGDDPLIDLNAQQRDLEKLNTELGFLMPHADREDHGKMSSEGRYRIWKEIWLLNYFGRSARYE